MTVANENSVIQYTLTSGTQNLPTNFYFLEASHLTVTKTVSGVDSVLVLNSDYSVNLPVVDAGNGSIDMITGTIGDVVTIENCPPSIQDTDYVENDRFPADVTERNFDKVMMLYNKLKSALFGKGSISSRFLQYPSTELSTNAITPILSDRQAGGNGTLAAFKGSDGAIDAISKGSVGVSLTLSNDSALGGGSPDAVNGVTQAAVKTYVDAADSAIQTELDDTQAGVGGLDASGNYVVKSGTNYLDGNADLNEDITDLDTQVKTNADNVTTNTNNITELQTAAQGIAIIEDQKSLNTDGGTFTSGAWQTRTLNTEVVDSSNIVTLSSNQFTLGAGTYLVEAVAPAVDCDEHQTRLQNITDGSTVAMGTSEYCQLDGSGPQQNASSSRIVSSFTIAASKAFEIQHRCTTTRATVGWGKAGNFTGATHEKYTIVKIQKLTN